MEGDFCHELAALLEKHRAGNRTVTPEHILAEYLIACLNAYNDATNDRIRWMKSNA